MANREELLDELLKDCKNAEDLLGKGGLIKDLTKVLIERALALLPEDPFILDSMGWVHYRLGNNDLAREYLQKAIDLRLDAEIAAHLGEVLWMDGERDQARAVWQRGQEDNPDNSVLRETLRKFDP